MELCSLSNTFSILIAFSFYRHGEFGDVLFCSLGNNFEGGLQSSDILPALLLVLALSAVAHHFFEEPVRKRMVLRMTKKV